MAKSVDTNSVPSEINQILPLALGALVNPSQQSGVAAARAQTASYLPLSNLHQATQILATQSVAKVQGTPKDQSVQIPKRSEPNFAPDEDKPQSDAPLYSNKAIKKKKGGSSQLDLVA